MLHAVTAQPFLPKAQTFIVAVTVIYGPLHKSINFVFFG